jgi:NAD-dependent deacetylase
MDHLSNAHRYVADRVRGSRHAIALTGAGISVESGIPDFRSPGGLWSRYNPMEYGHIEAFRRDPGKVWRMLLEMDSLLAASAPNPAHYALAELERGQHLWAVITQNVDSLHQRAGSANVIEYHGHGRTLRCDACGRDCPRVSLDTANLPPRCMCGGALRPNFVFFGEGIPSEAERRALLEAQQCDLLFVIGTSCTVAPASLLPLVAKEHGAYVVEINPEPTVISQGIVDLSLWETAGLALPLIVAALRD